MTRYGQDRGLPASPEAERAVLGAVILDGENQDSAILGEVLSLLSAEDFFLASHRLVSTAMIELTNDGQPITMVTLAECLSRHGQLEDCNGVAYLSSLTDGTPRRTSVRYYCEIIRDKARLREALRLCSSVSEKILSGEMKSKQCLSDLREGALSLEGADGDEGHSTFELTDLELARLQQELDTPQGTMLGIPLGVSSLDEVVGGLRKSELLIFAGRPGTGKTHFAAQTAITVAKLGIPVDFFSIEMTSGQFMRRLWQHEGQIPTFMMRDPRKQTAEARQALRRAAVRVAELPITIHAGSALTTDRFLEKAVLGEKRRKTGLVIVDYAQRLIARGKDEVERAVKQSQALAQLAKDYVPVLALAQLSRAPQHDMNKIPNMQDLKGSSQYEQDANIIVLIHRPRDEQNPKRETGTDILIVEKMREGEQSEVLPVLLTPWADFQPRWVGPDLGGPVPNSPKVRAKAASH